jgi:hypothetical protein
MALKFPISLVSKRESLQEETLVIDTNEDVIATIIGDIPNGYFTSNANVKRVIVGSSCTNIGDSAFRCVAPYALREVDFTNAVNLITIKKLAFSRARYLNTDLIFPESLQQYGTDTDTFNVAGAGGYNTQPLYVYMGAGCVRTGSDFLSSHTGITRVDMNMLNPPINGGSFIKNGSPAIHAPSNSSFGATFGGFTVTKDLPALS